MKNIALLSAVTLSFTLLTGCGSGTGNIKTDSVAQREMGESMALINKRRGDPTVQITAVQAKQNDAQRKEVDKEMDHQARKNKRAREELSGNMGLVGQALRIFH